MQTVDLKAARMAVLGREVERGLDLGENFGHQGLVRRRDFDR